jgi:hypothetical protein
MNFSLRPRHKEKFLHRRFQPASRTKTFSSKSDSDKPFGTFCRTATKEIHIWLEISQIYLWCFHATISRVAHPETIRKSQVVNDDWNRDWPNLPGRS